MTSDYKVYSLRTRIFTTLQTNYKPHNIVNITLKKFERDPHDDKRLNAHIEWQPARGLLIYNLYVHYKLFIIIIILSSVPFPVLPFTHIDKTCFYDVILGGNDEMFPDEIRDVRCSLLSHKLKTLKVILPF